MQKTRCRLVLACFILCFLVAVCRHGGDPSGRLYFEPPVRLIDDYTGMVEVDELNWAWAQPGFRLSRYGRLNIKPVSNLTGFEASAIQAGIDEGLSAWCKQAGIELSAEGQVSCEGAIVELKTERSFFQKINFFREETEDLFLETEFIIRETPTQNVLCKISHGVTALESDQLVSRLLSGLARYLDAHK